MGTENRRHARAAAAVAALALLLGAAGVSGATPNIDPARLDALLKVKLRTVQHMALNPVLVRAARSQNLQRMNLDEIRRRDEEWRGTKALTPFKLSLQTSDAGRFLKDTVSRLDSINEAFLTDNQGANVAAFPATSDYWQGDEPKWTQSFNSGSGRIFVGSPELDESTQTYAVQISAPVMDRGQTIGVLVVGVTISYLEAKGG